MADGRRSGRIPDEIIQQVIRETDILEVVSPHVRLTKAGTRYKGLCPFHTEKTPSFTVNPEKGVFYCFGCHKGGGTIQFLREIEGMSFVEAVEQLAAPLGIELRRETPEKASLEEHLIAVNRWAAGTWAAHLRGSVGQLEYLRSRGISSSSIESFGLGYAPDSWNFLIEKAPAAGFPLPLLERAGLVRTGRMGQYDFFRHRVIFPIHSRRGDPLAFGARALGADEKAKYINSGEGPLFSKRRNLYGLSHAYREIVRTGRVLFVEGYVDCILAHQAGFKAAVSPMGTALTSEQVRLLPAIEEAVLVFDGDDAGIEAAQKSFRSLLDAKFKVSVMVLPTGSDPADVIGSEGPGAFEKLFADRLEIFDFFVGYFRRRHAKGTVEGDAALVRDMMGLVAAVGDPIRRTFLVRRLSEEFRIDEKLLVEQMKPGDRTRPESRRRPAGDPVQRREGNPSSRPVAEQRALRPRREEEFLAEVLLEAPELARRVLDRFPAASFEDPVFREIAGIAASLLQQGSVYSGEDLRALLQSAPVAAEAARLFMPARPDTDYARHLEQLEARLAKTQTKKRTRALMERAGEASDDEVDKLLADYQSIIRGT